MSRRHSFSAKQAGGSGPYSTPTASEAKNRGTPGNAPGLPSSSPPGPDWLFALLLAATAFLAYWPALHGQFIWDDDHYVTENPLLTEADGLKRIWFSAHTQSQYFPLVFTTFRFERALWGLNPLGYHLVNLLLHALNALLLWTVLKRLTIPGAWLAAALFAVHPVEVESVAWITELKNLESTFFYLLALLAWMKFIRKEEPPPWRYYAVALVCHLLALFSKTTACTLPAAMLLVLWWRRDSIGWRRLAQIAPFLFPGVVMGLVSVWWEKHLGNYNSGFGLSFSPMQRLLIASRAVWFYAGKVLWPAGLSFSYPHWRIDSHAPGQYAGLIACAAVCGFLFQQRHKPWARGAMAAIFFFVAAIAPMLGFISNFTFHFAFVADHYQYLASAGLIALCAAAVARAAQECRAPAILFGFAAVVLPLLGALTWRQCGMYKDLETLWSATLIQNPDSSLAHNNLGAMLLHEGKVDEAISHFQRAIEIQPGLPDQYYNLGTAFVRKGKPDESIPCFQKALELEPRYADARHNLGDALIVLGRVDEAILQFQSALQMKPDSAEYSYSLGSAFAVKGRVDEAIALLRKALDLNPNLGEARNNLGLALSDAGRLDEVIPQLQQAVALRPNRADFHFNLGKALRIKGRWDEAIVEFRRALELQPENAPARSSLDEALRQKNQSQ